MKAYSFYDRVAINYNQPVNAKFYGHIADQLLDMLLPESHFNNILEVGAGTGFTTQRLRKYFADAKISALEPSMHMVSEAKKKNLDVEWLPIALRDFEKENDHDLVVSSMAAHWFSAYEWQKLLALNQKSSMALALPDLNSKIDTNANAVLRNLLFKLKPDILWPKHVRNFKLLLSNIKRDADRIEVKNISYTEEFKTSEELANNLFHRGVFLALFGSEALVAKNLFVQNLGNSPQTLTFNWSFQLIISYPKIPITY